MVFLTTPAVHHFLIQALIQMMSKNNSLKNAVTFKWAEDSPSFFKFLIKSYLPPLIVILINQVLLLLIFYLGTRTADTAYWENNPRYSQYQRSILSKAFFYMTFNVLIIPGFAATAVSNLFDLFSEGITNPTQMMKKLFDIKSGDFFVILILQAAGNTIFFSLNSIGELALNYFSPFLTHHYRTVLTEKESWTKNEGTIFQYGYNYSQSIVFIGIAIVFQYPLGFHPQHFDALHRHTGHSVPVHTAMV
jgi:hypothetical protein